MKRIALVIFIALISKMNLAVNVGRADPGKLRELKWAKDRKYEVYNWRVWGSGKDFMMSKSPSVTVGPKSIEFNLCEGGSIKANWEHKERSFVLMTNKQITQCKGMRDNGHKAVEATLNKKYSHQFLRISCFGEDWFTWRTINEDDGDNIFMISSNK